MNKNPRRRLRQERRRRLAATADQLLDSELVDTAKRNLEWIGMAEHLMRATAKSARPRLTIAVGAICVLIVACAWSIKLPRAHVAVELEASGIQLGLGRDWESTQALDSDRLVLDGMSGIVPPQLDHAAFDELGGVPTAAEIKNGPVQLKHLTFSAGASVELSASDSELALFVREGTVAGELYVGSVDAVLERGEYRTHLLVSVEPESPPETIGFHRSAGGLRPASIRISTPNPWRLADLKADRLGFLEEIRSGSGVFRSTILGGLVHVVESGLNLALNEGDSLILSGLLTKELDLTRSADGIRVIFKGSVSSVLAGPEGFERSLKPSLLAYIYRQQPLVILWSSVVFLFGFIWRAWGALSPYGRSGLL